MQASNSQNSHPHPQHPQPQSSNARGREDFRVIAQGGVTTGFQSGKGAVPYSQGRTLKVRQRALDGGAQWNTVEPGQRTLAGQLVKALY